MKTAQVQLPDALYQQVEGLAHELQVSVPELLHKAAEQMVERQTKSHPKPDANWRFPEGRRLGLFGTPVEDWRLHANEAAG